MPVAEAGGALGIDRDRAAARAERPGRRAERRRGHHQRGQAVPGREQRHGGAPGFLLAGVGARVARLRSGHGARVLPRPGAGAARARAASGGHRGRRPRGCRSALTPADSGGSPAAAQSASHQAAT